MDQKLTSQLQAWLNLPAQERPIEEGRILILRLIGNDILAENFQRNPTKYMPHVEYHFGKILPMRIAEVQHQDVQRMMAEEKTIAETLHLGEKITKAKTPTQKQQEAAIEKTPLGKRPDHDQLPEEIQSLWAENLPILQEMRALHERLVILSEVKNSTVCPDGDRYPLVKRLIELDKRSKSNYQRYDEYTAQN